MAKKENIQRAIELEENIEDYIEPPTKFDIDEYSIMEDFCVSLEDEKISNRLLNAIRGRGAFRRFKDMVYEFGIEQNWYDYRDNRYKDIAIDWCDQNNIKWVD